MKLRPEPARCAHGVAGSCASCKAFSSSLVSVVVDRDTRWRKGVLATLNRRAGGGR